MEKTDYKNKIAKTITENKRGFYVVKSPTGNSYTVKVDNIENFKKQMRVTDDWSIT